MSENDRYESYEPVPAGYDPLNAHQRELDLYGIPPRPDSSTHRRLYDFWVKLVSHPFVPACAELARFSGERARTQPPHGLESSLNWSGAVIYPPRPKRM